MAAEPCGGIHFDDSERCGRACTAGAGTSGGASVSAVCGQCGAVRADGREAIEHPADGAPAVVARARWNSLKQWLEAWVHEDVPGGHGGKSAQGCFARAALNVAGHLIVRGISYDFHRCFDLIDIELLLSVMEERGIDPGVLRALRGMYNQLLRRLKLGGCLSDLIKVDGGILQGCPLAMLCLNCLATCWSERSSLIRFNTCQHSPWGARARAGPQPGVKGGGMQVHIYRGWWVG